MFLVLLSSSDYLFSISLSVVVSTISGFLRSKIAGERVVSSQDGELRSIKHMRAAPSGACRKRRLG